MRTSHTVKSSKIHTTGNEEMLADSSSWNEFFYEQKLTPRQAYLLIEHLGEINFFGREFKHDDVTRIQFQKTLKEMVQYKTDGYKKLIMKLEVEFLLKKLRHEKDHSCFYANRIQKKINALTAILSALNDNAKSIPEILAVIQTQNTPNVRAGFFSHRTADLLDRLLRYAKPLTVIPLEIADNILDMLPFSDQANLRQTARFFNPQRNIDRYKELIQSQLSDKLPIGDLTLQQLKDLYKNGSILREKIVTTMSLPEADESRVRKLERLFIQVVRDGFEKLVSLFGGKVDYNADIQDHTRNDISAFLHVAASRHNHMVDLLLKGRANPNVTGYVKVVEVHNVVEFTTVTTELVNNGQGLTPLQIAAGYGQTASIQLLVQARAEINHPEGEHNMSALHIAAHKGQAGSIATLISAGANVTLRDRYDRTAENIAARLGNNRQSCLDAFNTPVAAARLG